MRNLYFFILLLILINKGFAQFNLTSSYSPRIGTYDYSVLDTTASEGNGGLGQTWNFSSYSILGTIKKSYTYPAFTPYGTYFPGSSLVSYYDTTLYDYYYADATKFSIIGAYVHVDTIINYIQYNNEFILYTYPFNFGTTQIHNATGILHDIQNGVTETPTYLKEADTVSIDGSGTLIVPGGNSYNAIRLKLIDYRVDSTNFGGSISKAYSRDVHYYFFAQGIDYPLIDIYYGVLTNTDPINGTTTDSSKSVIFYSNYVSNVQQPEIIGSLSVYPNPASTSINIKFLVEHSSSINISLEDLSGRNIYNFFNDYLSVGEHSLNLNLPYAINKGLYLVKIKGDDQVEIIKLVIN